LRQIKAQKREYSDVCKAQKREIEYMKRKIYNKLREWKEMSNGTSAMMVEGARRIGKNLEVND
jgi:hypothetical protein